MSTITKYSLERRMTKRQRERLLADYPYGTAHEKMVELAKEVGSTFSTINTLRSMLRSNKKCYEYGSKVARVSNEELLEHLWQKEDSFNASKLQHSSPEKFAEAVNRIMRGEAYYG